jgi:hypothetical protein
MVRDRSSLLRTAPTVWLGVAILIVAAIAVYSYLDAEAFRRAAERAERSRVVMEDTQRLLTLLKDAETAQRGYLLTGDPSYLLPYNQARPEIIARQRTLAQDDSADARRMASLIAAKLEELAQTIHIREHGDTAAALEIVRTDRGRAAMDQIRQIAERIIAQEHTQFRASNLSALRHGSQTRMLVQIGAILLAILLWTATRRINRLLRSQEHLILDLQLTREREAQGRAALSTTLRSIGDAVIATRPDGRIYFMNPIAETLTGWTGADAEGRPLGEVFRIQEEESRQPAADITVKVLRENSVATLSNHTILLAKDGREIPIDDSAAPIHDDAGNVTGVVLVFRDVTRRRNERRKLEESESRYRLMFESHPEAMWVFDVSTLAFIAVNEAAVARYGYSREEFLSMTLRDIRPAEDMPALLEHLADTRRDLRTDGPWRHRRKDGSVLFVEIATHSIRLGEIDAVLVMSTDITERRRLEDQLRQSQKLEAVGQLAGGIAHDFNNLLTVIEGYAEMIRAEQQPGDPHRDSLSEILVAAQRASSLTRQLLAFSRRQVLQPIRLNLNANVASTQRMLARLLGENIQIRTTLADDLWHVFVDPGQIDQIVINLAVNARDAMESGGALTILTANVDAREVDAARRLEVPPGEYVCLSIADTGHGMDEETRCHIFEPFFTTKEVGRGTGLGLSTVYGIVAQSGGHITVKSEPGQGATFSIYLPRQKATNPVRAPGTFNSSPALRTGETVLVVEDDETVRQLVGSMLRSSGYQVIAPATPSEALRICAEFTTPVDLLITDMVLPDTDGATVAREALAVRPGLKVLYMSGYTEHPVLRRAELDRATPFLQKPFTKAMLTAKVREVLQ